MKTGAHALTSAPLTKIVSISAEYAAQRGFASPALLVRGPAAVPLILKHNGMHLIFNG